VKKSSASMARATAKSATPARSASRQTAEQTPSFAAKLTVSAEPSEVTLVLRIVNTSTKRVEMVFPSGQIYDFVVLDSIGREVWHWAAGRMFTQTLKNKLLDGGEAMDVQETWKASALAPGRYTARAVLTSGNYPMTQTTEFTVGATETVAAREEP
jgi:hypothetical protein